MKNIRIISTLAAAVVAAAPLTGIAQQTFYNGTSNCNITAYADGMSGTGNKWPLDREYKINNSLRGKSSYTVNFEGSYLFTASDTTPVMVSPGKNGHVCGLFLTSTGRLVVKDRAGYRGNYWWVNPRPIATPNYGYNYSDCWLAFQWDGNVVVYAHRDYSKPQWWSGAQPHLANNGNKYTFSLTDAGKLNVAYNGYVVKTIG